VSSSTLFASPINSSCAVHVACQSRRYGVCLSHQQQQHYRFLCSCARSWSSGVCCLQMILIAAAASGCAASTLQAASALAVKHT
jgi:hypothetical protein